MNDRTTINGNRKNIHKLFYQDYFKGIKWGFVTPGSRFNQKENNDTINDHNKAINEAGFIPVGNLAWEEGSNTLKQDFQLQIIYPGLITGIGLTHNSKGLKGGYNLGMHFDYTTGMPIVYGSSVKGVLSAYFEEFYEDYINEHYTPNQKNYLDIKKKLSDAIFKGMINQDFISIYQRDIFFDAVIVNAGERKFLADDAITPHSKEGLKNPIPITMLKIASGCTLEFRFFLHDTTIGNVTFKAEDKLNLFKEILTTVGIGAKTNIGYGQLKEIKN